MKRKNIDLGFHNPIIKRNKDDLVLSRQITSHKEELRIKALEQVKYNLSIGANYGARYFLVNVPSKIRNIE